jgi:predicted RNase H-like HicB family nuclease
MTEQRALMKDDRDLFEMIRRGRELRRARGIPEPTGEFDAKEATEKWHEMRQAWAIRRQHYYIVIEPSDGFYRAYSLTLPQVEAQGETPQAAKEKVAEALLAYLKDLLAQGQPLPVERRVVDTVEISLT